MILSTTVYIINGRIPITGFLKQTFTEFEL